MRHHRDQKISAAHSSSLRFREEAGSGYQLGSLKVLIRLMS